jgi:glycerol-3-phosphate dehydrogenase
MTADLPLPSTIPVLILGSGIHGAAVARELVLNNVPVVVADTGDLAGGATSKSSRLIHGGLRYLEYGDVHLVRESLAERERLLKLAPQFVRPLRLFVPTNKRWSGLLRSGLGFFKLARTRLGRRVMGRSERRAPRGYWPIRMGLWMYDLFSWGDGLPKSRGAVAEHSSDANDSVASTQPRIDTTRFQWMCEYSDAQMRFPERCVIALLAEAESIAKERGLPFQIVPHAQIRWQDSTIQVADHQGAVAVTLRPQMVINCSGAWGDLTLKGIDAATIPMFAGTKGSHLVTRNETLIQRLGDQGIYAETVDRRLAFILPFGDAVLVGTTDEEWSGPPDEAVASAEELQYLLNVVESVFGMTLSQSDVESHYSGVRPLPRSTDTNNAAVSRDHSLAEHHLHGVPVVTLVGGKLTTFRSVATQISDRVMKHLGRQREATTDRRPILGSVDFPSDPQAWPELWQHWAADFGTTVEEVAAMWPLFGMQSKAILRQVVGSERIPIADSPWSLRTVQWVIQHEWVTTLDDLIERRLMLIFAPVLTRAMLQDLAQCLVTTGRLGSTDTTQAIERSIQRLKQHYGRVVL